jgi:hypothetical protein
LLQVEILSFDAIEEEFRKDREWNPSIWHETRKSVS